MKNSELEDAALKLFKKLDVEKNSSKIEDCHWLPSKGQKRVVHFPNKKMQTVFERLRKT